MANKNLKAKGIRSKKDQLIYDKTKKYLEKIKETEIEGKMKIIDQILEKEEGEERYSYLYDILCDYLDQEFKKNDICGFHNNICKRRCHMMEENKEKDTYDNGCCYSYLHKRNCEHLNAPYGCKIKNLGCKTFTCFYLKKQGIRYSLSQIYLSRYFFNRRQKFYIEHTFFVDKPVIMEGIMKRR